MIDAIKKVNYRSDKTKGVLVFFLVYFLAAAFSSWDFAGKTSNLFCTMLTVVVAIGALIMARRLYRLAKKIETAPQWHTNCVCRDSLKQVVLLVCVVIGYLGILKLWAVGDIFIEHWVGMPWSYHAQSWAFLVQNAGAVLVSSFVYEICSKTYKCAQMPKSFVSDADSSERIIIDMREGNSGNN